MSSCLLSNLNTISRFSSCRAVGLRKSYSFNSEEALFGKGRVLSGNSFLNKKGASLSLKSSKLSTSRPDCQIRSNRNSLFVVEALPQTHCGRSVFGSFCQVFEHRSDKLPRKPMSASGSKPASGDLILDNLISSCGHVSDFAKPSAVYFNGRSRYSFHKSRMTMKIREPYKSNMVSRYFIFDSTQKSCSSGPIVGQPSQDFHASSLCCFGGTEPDVPLNETSRDEQLASSAISADEDNNKKSPGGRNLKLLSGSCYLPHPEKEETGGEDAHFICEDEQTIGVADGVGGWASVGVNAGLYARELMSNSVRAIRNEPMGCINPARVLHKAHSKTKAQGSSTACIITLTDKGLHAINLGDSGFIVVRDGSTVFESPVQQHGFNFTYQLQNSRGGDLPSSGEVFIIPVVPGDVIVAGTDGLFDNMFNNEVTAVVAQGVTAGLTPEATAQKIAALARQRALDTIHRTPFSIAAQKAGYSYRGGKLDDLTVVVSYIIKM